MTLLPRCRSRMRTPFRAQSHRTPQFGKEPRREALNFTVRPAAARGLPPSLTSCSQVAAMDDTEEKLRVIFYASSKLGASDLRPFVTRRRRPGLPRVPTALGRSLLEEIDGEEAARAIVVMQGKPTAYATLVRRPALPAPFRPHASWAGCQAAGSEVHRGAVPRL